MSDKMPPVVREIRDLMQKSGLVMNFDSVMVLSALWPILQGIEAAQSFDTEKVVVAMENMESFDTPWGKARWAGEEINGNNHMAKLDTVPITRIMNGQIEFEWVEQPK